MATTYISLAVSATMFPSEGQIKMWSLTPSDVRMILNAPEDVTVISESGANVQGQIVSALNPSHASTIDVIHRKFDINLPIPEKAPKVSLNVGDSVLIIQAQLPRLNEGEVHSQATVENAPISFRLWTVTSSD